jgi:hypothetical protein
MGVGVFPHHVEVGINVTGVNQLRDLIVHMGTMGATGEAYMRRMTQLQMMSVQSLDKMAAHTGRITEATGKAHQSWQRLHMGITATRLALMWIIRAGVQGIIQFGKEAFKTADQIQIMQITMERFMGTAKMANAQLNELKKIAITSPFGLTSIMGLGASLTAANPYFRNPQNLQKSVKGLQDLAASRSILSGGEYTMEESMQVLMRNLTRFMVQTGSQMKGQYLGQLQRMFPLIPWKEIKEKAGSDAEKMMTLIMQAIEQHGFVGMSKSLEKTWQAQWSNFKDWLLIGASQGMGVGRQNLIDKMYQIFAGMDFAKIGETLQFKIGGMIGQLLQGVADYMGTSGAKGLGRAANQLITALGGVMIQVEKLMLNSGGLQFLVHGLGTSFTIMGKVLEKLNPLLRPILFFLNKVLDIVDKLFGFGEMLNKAVGMPSSSEMDAMMGNLETQSLNNETVGMAWVNGGMRGANAAYAGLPKPVVGNFASRFVNDAFGGYGNMTDAGVGRFRGTTQASYDNEGDLAEGGTKVIKAHTVIVQAKSVDSDEVILPGMQ